MGATPRVANTLRTLHGLTCRSQFLESLHSNELSTNRRKSLYRLNFQRLLARMQAVFSAHRQVVQPSRTGALTVDAKRAFGDLLPLLDWVELRDMLIQVVQNRGCLWVDHGGTMQEVPGWVASPEAVRSLAVALISAGGRHIDELNPCADVRLGDGIRVHAVLPPASVAGAAVSIRVPRITHRHWGAVEARQSNSEGVGALSLDRLLREALRMRPDRIVLGECRGAELLTLLAALNTGHDGGAGTLHASSLADVPARLEALGALGGLSPAALARQVCAALHLVVHLERSAEGQHRISALGRFQLYGDVLTVEEL